MCVTNMGDGGASTQTMEQWKKYFDQNRNDPPRRFKSDSEAPSKLVKLIYSAFGFSGRLEVPDA